MFTLSAQNIHKTFMFESLHFRFLLSALNTAKRDQNIVLGYTLEVTCTHNQFFGGKMKNKVYSSKSKFNNTEVEFKGGLHYMGISSYYFKMTIEAS